MPASKKVRFVDVVNSLLDNNTPFPAVYLPQFSDLTPESAFKLQKAWSSIAPQRRVTLLEDLEEIINSDTLMSFDEVARIAMQDSLGKVRELAILLVWETLDHKLIPQFLRMAQKDPDPMVRAQAVSILGRYMLLGEMEELSEKNHQQIEKTLLSIYNSQDELNVRRFALESLGYSSQDPIPGMILESYQQDDPLWKASALSAMGRSSDDARWGDTVLHHLSSDQYDLQMEAIRAAGNMGLESARGPLLKMLDEGVEDEELRDMVIWSLSNIGGEGVMEAFKNLMEKAEGDDEIDMLEGAIDTLMILSGQGLDQPGFFGLDVDDMDLEGLEDEEEEDEDDQEDEGDGVDEA